AGAPVAPLHAREDAVGATLQAQVQVRADARVAGHRAHQVVARLGRLQAAEPQPEVARQRTQPVEQVPQPAPLPLRLAAAQVDAVVAEVDPRQHDLRAAALDQAGDLLDDLFRGAAPQARPDARDDAERAVEHAAVLHLDEGALVAVEARDAARRADDAEVAQLVGD